MKKFDLKDFGPVISDKDVGATIYGIIKKDIDAGEILEIDLANIKSMATYCAKQIFGNLYVELGPHKFYEVILIKNASNDLKTIINIGIQHALKEVNK